MFSFTACGTAFHAGLVGEFLLEHFPTIRARCLEGLASLGFVVDREKNELSRTRNAETLISADGSPVKIFVIPTDEEMVMTEDTVALIEGHYDVHTGFNYSFQRPDYRNTMREEGLISELEKNPKLRSILAVPH